MLVNKEEFDITIYGQRIDRLATRLKEMAQYLNEQAAIIEERKHNDRDDVLETYQDVLWTLAFVAQKVENHKTNAVNRIVTIRSSVGHVSK